MPFAGPLSYFTQMPHLDSVMLLAMVRLNPFSVALQKGGRAVSSYQPLHL
jgi:hypothetical protein